MNTKIIVIIVVAIVVLAGGYFLVNSIDKSVPEQPMNLPTNSQANNNQEAVPAVDIQIESDANQTITNHEVVYTDSGFSPSTLTIKAGNSVTFKNQSSAGMWVASASHPSHTVYSGTSLQQHCPDGVATAFDECVAVTSGGSWSFTFNKSGSWGYHNHPNASKFGKIVVE